MNTPQNQNHRMFDNLSNVFVPNPYPKSHCSHMTISSAFLVICGDSTTLGDYRIYQYPFIKSRADKSRKLPVRQVNIHRLIINIGLCVNWEYLNYFKHSNYP